jgi:hypothetical protein
VRDPEAVAVGETDRTGQRRGELRPLVLLYAGELVVVLRRSMEELPELGDLREDEGVFADGEIPLERVEREAGHRDAAEDGDPVVDLPLLDLDRGRQLLLRAHDVMRRHLAEVAREHGVTAAFVGALVGRRLHRLHHVELGGDRVAEVELLVERVGFRFGQRGCRRGARRVILELAFSPQRVAPITQLAHLGGRADRPSVALRPCHPRCARRRDGNERGSGVALALAHVGVLCARRGAT